MVWGRTGCPRTPTPSAPRWGVDRQVGSRRSAPHETSLRACVPFRCCWWLGGRPARLSSACPGAGRGRWLGTGGADGRAASCPWRQPGQGTGGVTSLGTCRRDGDTVEAAQLQAGACVCSSCAELSLATSGVAVQCRVVAGPGKWRDRAVPEGMGAKPGVETGGI